MKKFKVAFILGIRPDVIRAYLILKYLEKHKDVEVSFIWSGQHYSDNLKDIFFRELGVRDPDIDLGAKGEGDSEIVGMALPRLAAALKKIQPTIAVFLGDTNTVLTAIAAAQQNIPIFHIEGGMRSYDWRMPEEKNRTVIDNLSDVIYVYLDQYKKQAIAEGLNPKNLVVVGNPIVDVLHEYYVKRKKHFESLATPEYFKERGLLQQEYFLMTCHRRENVEDLKPFKRIIKLTGLVKDTVYFPASYRTQKVIATNRIKLPKNIIMVDPIGYEEFLTLLVNSKGVLTDSGTVVEEACVLNVPCVQMRKASERTHVYDVKAAVKFDPTNLDAEYSAKVLKKLNKIIGTTWKHPFGDGKTSERIAADIYKRLKTDAIHGHTQSESHLKLHVRRSHMEDGINAR